MARMKYASQQVKLKLHRDDFIKGIEHIFLEFNQSEKLNRGIEKGFHRLGQDVFNPAKSKAAFVEYLNKMRESEVFGNDQFPKTT